MDISTQHKVSRRTLNRRHDLCSLQLERPNKTVCGTAETEMRSARIAGGDLKLPALFAGGGPIGPMGLPDMACC
jgi:hypothetical protein